MRNKRIAITGGALLAVVSHLHAADVNVTADINTNTTWTAENAYILDKSIFVKNGATLTIEAGTTILGTKNVDNGTYGSLIITREGTIMAEGTAEAPIVMTAKEDRDAELTADTADDLDPATGDGGLWGGLVILGSAPINYYTGPTTNANENSIEGFPAGSSADILYGGNDATDNSGIVKYVSIRFGGYEYAANREINGLTMGGVGSGTIIENVEVVSNTDDGVEIFGGTVNTKRIAVAFCQDDSFDLDEGHQGYHQFWFAIQNANNSLGDRGGEWDGGNGNVVTGTPYTTATIYNATFIGNGEIATGSSDNAAFYVDDNFAGQLHNSVVHQFTGAAVAVSPDGIGNEPNPLFQNVTWGAIAGGAGSLSSVSVESTVGTDPLLRGISRTANGGLDPRPKGSSPLRSSTLSDAPVGAPAGFFETTTYRGAFGDTNWLDGWSYLSQHGYLGDLPEGSTGDISPPVITLIGANPIILDVGDIFEDPGANVTDNLDESRTITGTGAVNTNEPGTYTITYGTSDAAGNSALTVTRSVIVNAPTIPSAVNFVTSTGSPLNIADYFKNEIYKTAMVAVEGKLPKGMTFNSKTKAISGFPAASGQARFKITLPDKSPVTLVMSFTVESVPTSLSGTHILHTDEGDAVTLTLTNKAGVTLAILSPTATKPTSAKGIVKLNTAETDPSKQWALEIPAQAISIAFPAIRTLKAGDNSLLGYYGTLAGKPLWGFKNSDNTGEIALSKGGSTIKISGVLGAKGSVAWTVSPATGKAIKTIGRLSADGIASIRANVPGNGQLIGMLRVDEAFDGTGQPTGQLNVSLLQGFDGWTPVSYTTR